MASKEGMETGGNYYILVYFSFEQIFDEFLCRNPTNQNNASDEEKDGNGKNCANEGNGADADADNCEKTTTSAAEMPMQKRKIGMSLKVGLLRTSGRTICFIEKG